MDVDEQLREWLRGCGVSPKKIGEEAGVDYSQIYKFLKGTVELRSGSFARLCRWANLTLEPEKDSIMAPLNTAGLRTHELENCLTRIREITQDGLHLLAEFRDHREGP